MTLAEVAGNGEVGIIIDLVTRGGNVAALALVIVFGIKYMMPFVKETNKQSTDNIRIVARMIGQNHEILKSYIMEARESRQSLRDVLVYLQNKGISIRGLEPKTEAALNQLLEKIEKSVGEWKSPPGDEPSQT